MEPPATSLSTHHPANPPVAPSCRAAGGVTEPPAWSQPRARCYSAVQGQLRLTGEEVGQTRQSECVFQCLAGIRDERMRSQRGESNKNRSKN